tara:strand:- start:295 stop:939 length:645 start_codon:yes stop_codon:yes gene_type:complete
MSNLRFKLANKNDKKFLFFLKNEKEARNNSKNKKIIQFNKHKIWFTDFLKNKKNKLIIASFQKKQIGYVKFEYLTNNLYKTSINIKKQFRGKNLSNEILVKSEKFLQKGIILLAEVKKKNVKSKKTFISGDYIEYNSSKNFIEYFKLINKSHSNQVAKISKVIKDIEAVRKNNNLNWMSLLKLSFKENPEATKKLFNKIYLSDRKINKLSKKII